jgi:glycosyltransferase involved in cell wall biosynthesis
MSREVFSMRLGIDACGLQLLSAADRAPIRRVVEAVVESLPDNSVILYMNQNLPPLMPFSHVEFRFLPTDAAARQSPLQAIQSIADENPDHLDALLIAAPLAASLTYRPPQLPQSRLKLAALVHGSPARQTMAAMLARYDLLIELGPVAWPASMAPRPQNVLTLPMPLEPSAVQAIIHRLMESPHRVTHRQQKRIAFFAPLPPSPSGIADYSVALIEHLNAHVAVDLFHQTGYIPDAATQLPDFGVYEHTMFPTLDAAFRYDALVYQMGNSHFHDYIYKMLLRYPGIVCLHDFGIGGFHAWHAAQPETPPEYLTAEIESFAGPAAPDIIAALPQWSTEPDGLRQAFSDRRIYLNRRVFDHSQAVILHDPWCRQEVSRLFPELLDRVAVVPAGTTVHPATSAQRQAVRNRFDLPAEALIFASFGILHPHKLNDETIEAFAAICRDVPEALLVFVGRDLACGQAAAKALALGVQDRVRFLGHVDLDDFAELAACVDVGINLRRAPTNGETSASLLNLLSTGIPCIASDVDTFSSYPDDVVCKVPASAHLVANLAAIMLRLARDLPERRTRGDAALEYVRQHHSWDIAARGYAQVIDRIARPTGLSAAS